jgi:hypothetical protein
MLQVSGSPKYLVPQCQERHDGVGSVIDLGDFRGKLLVVTLGINDVVEQEGLEISIWGSAEGSDWGTKPLLTFPQKSYCGVYATILNLTKKPATRFLRVQWTMSRRAEQNSDLLFGFYVSLEEVHSDFSAAVA